MRFYAVRSGLCWDVDSTNYWLLWFIISWEVGGDELMQEGAFLNSYSWALVCDLFGGGGLFCVDKILGLGQAVCAEDLLHDYVMEFVID